MTNQEIAIYLREAQLQLSELQPSNMEPQDHVIFAKIHQALGEAELAYRKRSMVAKYTPRNNNTPSNES